VGGLAGYAATGTFSDGSTADVTNVVAWSVTPASGAVVSGTGGIRAKGLGAATVTAASGPRLPSDRPEDLDILLGAAARLGCFSRLRVLIGLSSSPHPTSESEERLDSETATPRRRFLKHASLVLAEAQECPV
jgi:hypothetical protein